MLGYSISRWVNFWAENRGDSPVIEFDGSTITWSELNHRMERGARHLRSLGVAKGDRVAIMMSNRPEYYEVFFSIIHLGAIFVPVNPRLSTSEITFLVQDSGAKILVTESAFEANVTAGTQGTDCRLINIDTAKESWSADAERHLASAIDPPTADDVLTILYTSGTTGKPKGAVLTHSAFMHSAENLVHAYSYTQSDRHLVVLPLSFTGGILTLSQPVFVSGGTIVLEPQFEPGRVLKVLSEQQVTVFFAAPALLQLLRIAPNFEPSAFKSVRLIVAGAAPVPEVLLDFYQSLGVAVGQGYGLTEGGAVDTFLLAKDASRKIGSVGRSCIFTETRIVDEDGNSVPAGTPGEIVLRGPNMMREYWNNPEATAAAFVNGWLRTGDVGVMDDEGYISIVDRLKDLVITGGMNVYPAEVEAAVFQHEAVAEAAVLGVPHEVYGETVVAAVVLRDGATLSIAELREFCHDKLADYKLPRRLVQVEAIPRNASSKVQKFVLRDMVLSGKLTEL